MTLVERIQQLATAIGGRFKALEPRLVAEGGNEGEVYVKTLTGHDWVAASSAPDAERAIWEIAGLSEEYNFITSI